MATLSKAESRRLYSWWWDSHIPKNSKWLQDNLTDMDVKVKSMIKLIEEDADSFARRAEMYYKKRPELMNLVEEFYRAYRALAERYDHATGALRQAQKTMSEVFPNQIPFALADESPSGTESEPRTPDVPPPKHTFLDSDDPQRDASGPPTQFVAKRNGAYSDDAGSLGSKKGLKQLSEMVSSGEGPNFSKFGESRARKGLNFQEEEGKGPGNEMHNEAKGLQKNGGDEDASSKKLKKLQEQMSQLSAENQNLKTQVMAESEHRSKVEIELQWLQGAQAKLESEKEEALIQFHLSLRRLSDLVAEIESFKTQNTEMLVKIAILETIEEEHLQLEKEYQFLKLEASASEQKKYEQQEELAHKQEELEKLKISLQDEHMRCVHAEAALESLETLHTKSVEALKLSALEIQNVVQLLRETEMKKQCLEEELQNAKEEIENLNVENVSTQQMIETLQVEISCLKKTQEKLENDVENHVHANNSLEQELCGLKEELSDLQLSHKSITDQIEAVGMNEEYFAASVKELQDANLELKEVCDKKEDENGILLKKLEQMHEISEKNALLESSVSDANVKLEGLRFKIKELEESCEVLHDKNSSLESEKNALVSKIETVTDGIVNLSEKNTFLENSLSNAVVEIEGLKGTLKSLEESCRSLQEDKSNLQIEKRNLLSQVEVMGNGLEDLEKKYAELNGKHSILEEEKEWKNSQLAEMQDLFKLKRQQYEAFMESSNAKLASMEDRIQRLCEDGKSKDREFQDEQLKLFTTQTEIFILQRFLYDLKDKKLNLSRQWQEMEQYIFRQQEKEVALLERIERLRKMMLTIWKDLSITEDWVLTDGQEELYLKLIFAKIKGLQDSFRGSEDEKQSLLLEKSVYITLLQQLGHHMADLRSEKNALYRDCRKKTEELLNLQREMSGLLEMNEQLRHESETGQLREKTLEEEIEILGRQSLGWKEAHLISQDQNQKLLEENKFLSGKCSNLRDEIHSLEEECAAIFHGAVVRDSLTLIFEQFSSEKIKDLRILNDDLSCTHRSYNDLENEVLEMAEKAQVLEAENSHLKDMALKLEECRDHLTLLAVDMSMSVIANKELNSQIEQLDELIEKKNHLLIQKDMVLLDTDRSTQVLQNQNSKLHDNLEGIKLELDEVKLVRDELEKNITVLGDNMTKKDEEIMLTLEANEMLGKELHVLKEENEDLRVKEKESALMLLDEINSCEEEFAALCNDFQLANIRAALYEEKALELMGVCESLEIQNLVEREVSHKEFISRNAHIEDLNEKLEGLEGENREMKAELNEYASVVPSLGSSISAMAELILPLRKSHHGELQQTDTPIEVVQDRSRSEPSADLRGETPQGILELQKLLAKIDTLQQILVESGGYSVPSDSHGNAGAGSRRNHHSMADSVISPSKDELKMKDIQLDHVSSSFKYDGDDGMYGFGSLGGAEIDDQMLLLWETAERDCSDKKQRSPRLPAGINNSSYRIREVEEEDMSEYPSMELVAEKELGVDRLEVPKNAKDSSQGWNKEVLERLSSDAKRLTALQKGVQELKSKMEKSEQTSHPKSFEYDTIKIQLQDAESTILQLVETNRKLTKRVHNAAEPEEANIQRRRQVLERARRGSDKIGRLELDLQKFQYILLKLEEEFESHRSRAASRKSRVLLRDYLYGRRDKARKKGHLCGCIGSSTTKD